MVSQFLTPRAAAGPSAAPSGEFEEPNECTCAFWPVSRSTRDRAISGNAERARGRAGTLAARAWLRHRSGCGASLSGKRLGLAVSDWGAALARAASGVRGRLHVFGADFG